MCRDVWHKPPKRRPLQKKRNNIDMKGTIGRLKNIDMSPRPHGLCERTEDGDGQSQAFHNFRRGK